MRKYISSLYRQNEEHLPLDYRFFDRFLYYEYRYLIQKRIVFTATSDMKTMRSASLMEQYSVLISSVLKCTQMANFSLGSSN